MRLIGTAVLLVFSLNAASPATAHAQTQIESTTPEQVVRRLLDAGNRSDLETWLSLFHPEARQFRKSEDSHRLADRPSATITDTASRRRVYAEIFSRPERVRAEILGMMSLGELVVSRGVFHTQAGPIQTLTVYRVRNGLIHDIWDIEQQRE